LYLCIKRRKKRQAHLEAGHLRRASGVSSSEKDGIGFAKDSLGLGQGPPGMFRGHQPQGSQSSFSSVAILMGRTGPSKSSPSGLSRKLSNDSRRDSSDSTFRAFKSTISKPMLQTTITSVAPAPPRAPPSQAPPRNDKGGAASGAKTAEPRTRNLTAGADAQETTRRSSGWNRYWSGGSALGLLGFGGGNSNNNNSNSNNNNNNASNANPSNGNAAAGSGARRITARSDRSSDYGDRYRMTQDSATVPPLFPGNNAERMSFSRVNAQSPTIAVYNDKLPKEGMSGRIETQRPVSAVSDMSGSAYSSGIPESVQEAWDPTTANRPWGAGRAQNDSFTGVYSTPLAPASQQQGAKSQRREQPPVRDDMSWLNLGGGR
jgi:hypothetical protein